MELKFHLAESDEDFEDARNLSRMYRDWLYENYPSERYIIEAYYGPSTFERILADFPVIHSRPRGSILLARQGAVPVGCVMQQDIGPNITEMKRLYVSNIARGCGVGVELVKSTILQAKRDGYQSMRLETSYKQTAAIQLYRRMGFEIRGPYHEVSQDLESVMMFFELRL